MGKKEVKMSGTMELKSGIRTVFVHKRVFKWNIGKYTLLEYGRLYHQVYISNGLVCAYKLLKARGKLFLAFQCEYSNAYGMFYLYNGNRIMKLVDGIEISDGLYVGDFPESLIRDTNGDYMLTGLLNIAFRFVTGVSTSEQYNPAGEFGHFYDYDELCRDIRSGLIDSRRTDFILRTEAYFLKVHKCVLYARSGFFEEYFTKDEQATEFTVPSDFPTGIVFEVLLYMHSGELTSMNTDSMVKVLELAYLLKIPSLKEKCFNYFEETDSWNAIEAVDFAEYKIEDC